MFEKDNIGINYNLHLAELVPQTTYDSPDCFSVYEKLICQINLNNLRSFLSSHIPKYGRNHKLKI